MTPLGRKKIVVLGMLAKLRVAGAIWQVLHYLAGLRRLGYDAFYVDDNGSQRWAFGANEQQAAAFLDSVFRRFDFGQQWAFRSRWGSGACYGMSERQLSELYRSSAAVLNLHCGTTLTSQQASVACLIGIDTDPVELQVKAHEGVPETLDLLAPHHALFTFGENYGSPNCPLPASGSHFLPTRQPVVLDFWEARGRNHAGAITTVGNWYQARRVVEFEGEEYQWSKHLEFAKFLELPRRSSEVFELALSKCDSESRALLEQHGWRVREACRFSLSLDQYRQYIRKSKGEFTVAKDQNIRFRTGWFSDRSATYLAAGRPVITQETGFSDVLPTGRGLFAFSSMDDILTALAAIDSNYECQRRAALDITREYFSHDVVLKRLLSTVGISIQAPSPPGNRTSGARPHRTTAVNVIASLKSGSGMATTARRYMRAFRSLGLVVNPIDVSDMSREPDLPRRPGDLNIICVDLRNYFAVFSYLGDKLLCGRHNIGLWLWELSTFPARWCDRFAYCDEVWTPSAFLASTFAPRAPVPVVRVPHVLSLEAHGCRRRGRRRLGLKPDEFAFAYTFDFHSCFERKNPLGVIDAFKRAFKSHDAMRLIIKCVHPAFRAGGFEELKRQAEGYPISIFAEPWSTLGMLDFTAACDCYISLHRAEGLGLTISDAMAAAKPVIATGWSGNMDYMTIANSFPVRYELKEIERDIAQYSAGEIWAEPCIDHAAELMRQVFRNTKEAALVGRRACWDIRNNYSESVVASSIASRLDVIEQAESFKRLQERLRQPVCDLSSMLTQFDDLGNYVPSEHASYSALMHHLRRVVQAWLQADATVAIASRGDDQLLKVVQRRAFHFPQSEDGRYAGYHPADSAEAIRLLEATRSRGAEFLLFPSTTFWWLEHYGEFGTHLREHYKLAYNDASCWIFELSGAARKGASV